MPRGKTLNDFEQGRIIELYRQRYSQREIANEVNRSKTVVCNFLKNPDAYKKSKISGRPEKLINVIARKIKREIKINSVVSSKKN